MQQDEQRRSPRTHFRRARRDTERIRALGVEMDFVRPEEVMHHVTAKVEAREPFTISNYNLHAIYLARRNPEFAAFCRSANLIEVDSTPIILFTRLLGLHARRFHRCTYLDWRPHFWSVANRKGWRVFYLGSAPGVAEKAADKLRAAYPGALIATRHGYFDATPGSAENEAVLAEIKAFQPDILFIGMGMPRQEIWLHRNAASLPVCVAFTVGAAFDYEAGVQAAAPRWMGRLGIEWLYRLARDPKRLFARYCVEPWFLLPLALGDIRRALAEGRLLRAPGKQAGKRAENSPIVRPRP